MMLSMTVLSRMMSHELSKMTPPVALFLVCAYVNHRALALRAACNVTPYVNMRLRTKEVFVSMLKLFLRSKQGLEPLQRSNDIAVPLYNAL